MSMEVHVSVPLAEVTRGCAERIRMQLPSRAYRGANELRNASQLVLRGQRSGRRYPVPGTERMRYNKRKKTATITVTKYSASAPGEPPAVRTGAFRASWRPIAKSVGDVFLSRIESDARTNNGRDTLGEILERGTSKMAPRPHHDRIIEKAMPAIQKIYREPYV